MLEHSGRVVDYTYDVTYRLTEEAITDPVNGNDTITYTYDSFGNRLTKTDSSGTITYTYDVNDRLITETASSYAYTYTYDENGNTLTRSDGSNIIVYEYDFENRLVTVDTGVSVTDYEYDADGIRVSSNTDGAITDYLVDKNRDYAQVLEERDGSGSLTVDYVYGDDLISRHRGIGDYFYLYDGQMSTRQLTDSSETVANEYTYDAFGILLDEAGVIENNYRYTGEQFDPNVGLYYLRARYMNPEIGRFVTTDPWQGNIFEPASLHKYLYANANPVMFNDLSGQQTLAGQMRVTFTIGVLTTIAVYKCSLDRPRVRSKSYVDVVYRGLRVMENRFLVRFLGIFSQGWGLYSPSKHIELEPKDSIWISTTRSYRVANDKYASKWVATISLDKIGKWRIYDTTIPSNYNRLSELGKLKALPDHEVLIFNWITPKAIVDVMPKI